MKKPIAVQLIRDEESYFKNEKSPISAMCSAFASELNQEAKKAQKIEFEISRSPFKGSQQIFSSRYVVSKKKDDERFFGLPFTGSVVASEVFNINFKGTEKKRFYAKLTVLS